MTTLVVVVLLVIGFVAVSWYDTYSYEKRVPLGSWYGTFTAPGGQKGALLLVVRKKTLANGSGGYISGPTAIFPGVGKVCVAGFAATSFVVNGSTEASGPAFELGPASSPAVPEGAGFIELRGVNRTTSLALTGTLAALGRDRAPSRPDIPGVAITAVKGSEAQYRAACAAAGAQP